MTTDDDLLEETAEDLFENAPCGYLSCRLDGTILRVNRTFEAWTGHRRETLVGKRFVDLLTPAGRIYHETHYRPLLEMQGSVREIALEILRADGERLPTLINSVQQRDEEGRPRIIRTTVFDATDRRSYERELLRARRAEQEIAQQLQRSLLSGELPSTDTLAIDVVYRPAVAGLEVGGDWYDAFWLGEGVVGLVVGDVVGRGIEAAATMGQLRSATRALASTGLAPGPLLDALDRFAAHHRVGRMATLAYAELNLTSGAIRYACAGHPPPLLVQPGQRPCFAWDARSVPLDAASAPDTRTDATTRLVPGGAVLLYTDGLVERRSQSIDEGLDRLAEEAARVHEAGAPLTTIVRNLGGTAEPGDDVCLLVAQQRSA